MIRILITAAYLLTIIPTEEVYADTTGIAAKIIEGIKPNTYHPDQRLTDDWNGLIKEMKKNGIIPNKPTEGADYTDYYRIKSPQRIFWHDLVVFEHEYRQVYLGCCVSPGIGLVLKVNGSIQNLKNIALTNKCSLDYPLDTNDYMVKLKPSTTSGYAYLSCRKRDLTSAE